MGDQRAVVADQGVHSAERMLPVGVGELAAERLDDHSACILTGLVVEIGGVDQAGGVDLGVHTVVLPGSDKDGSVGAKRFAWTLAVLGALVWAEPDVPRTISNQLVMPDLTGKYWAGAQPQLDALGWRRRHELRRRRSGRRGKPRANRLPGPAGRIDSRQGRRDHAAIRAVTYEPFWNGPARARPVQTHGLARAGLCATLSMSSSVTTPITG